MIRKIIDITGLRSGSLVAVSHSGKGIWRCQCDCGNISCVDGSQLRKGIKKSCGCSRYAPVDHTGRKFGKWTAIRIVGGNRGAIWECRCDCGVVRNVTAHRLVSGGSRSCGCTQKIDPNRMNKVCGICNQDKDISMFGNRSNSPDGHDLVCLVCVKARNKSRQPVSNIHIRERRLYDDEFRIKSSLRSRIQSAIKGNTKSARTLELLGCDVDYLKYHLESKFNENMSWNNYGTYWHIDHIKPCAAFDLTQESEQRVCFHYTNLQPLEKIANIRKGDKYYE